MPGRLRPAMPGAAKAELAAQQLDLLNHYRWHFANELPVDEAYFNKFSALAEVMEVPPHLRGDMASLAAAGRRGDASAIRRLLPGLYEALAAAPAKAGGGDEGGPDLARKEWQDSFRQLKTALDNGDQQGIAALMSALRARDDLDSRARELYIFLYDKLMMGEMDKAAGALGLWMNIFRA